MRWPLPSHTPTVGYSITRNRYGVGYDSVTDDYKVISLSHFLELNKPTISCLSIYSLKSNTWNVDIPYDFTLSPPAVYVNGFVHSVANKFDGSSVMVAFSLEDESFSEVPSPDLSNIDRKISKCKLVVINGKLAIYVNHEKLKVWLMNEYGVKNSWSKIPLDTFNSEFRMERPVIFDENGKIRVAGKGQMVIYDFKKGKLSENTYVWSSLMFQVFDSYFESLVSVPKKVVEQVHPEDTMQALKLVKLIYGKLRSNLLSFSQHILTVCQDYE
uniref:F-box/kelch-repeat protein At3g06240-like n=1 Tax=Erigeron canadensis TaxID=72917 RepID=UPI001CB974A8|nr:F-box/kelch-repeat protein At3g06240-like [Erigeron canadensis]